MTADQIAANLRRAEEWIPSRYRIRPRPQLCQHGWMPHECDRCQELEDARRDAMADACREEDEE